MLFASIGGLAGLVLGGWTLRGLVPLFAASLPPSLAIDVDARAALFTAGLAIAIGVLFGAVAAYRPGHRIVESLAGTTRSTASPSTGRTRNALVVAQVALAVVLLSAAGLMLNTFGRLSRVNPGFAADHVLTFRVALLGDRYAAAPPRVGFVSDVLARVSAVPGVRSAAVTSVVGGSWSDRIGRRAVIGLGWLIYAVVYVGFAISTTLPQLLAWFLLYGFYFGFAEGTEKALVADLAPPTRRGFAFGVYTAVQGLGALAASVVFGAIWSAFGAAAAFGVGGGLALLATALLFIAVRPARL